MDRARKERIDKSLRRDPFAQNEAVIECAAVKALKQGMLFVIGTETMSKDRFIFMSMLPNIIFGIVPYVIGMIFPKFIFMTMFGMICTSMGAGDYYNVFNAIRQVPKNGRVYMSGMRSYWYLEK